MASKLSWNFNSFGDYLIRYSFVCINELYNVKFVDFFCSSVTNKIATIDFIDIKSRFERWPINQDGE